jgi:hypothetical protein
MGADRARRPACGRGKQMGLIRQGTTQ